MSKMIIQPYLSFGGRCEEAIDFYREAVGAEVEMLMLFKDSPDPLPPEMIPLGYDNKVMHATLRVGESILMMSDGCGEGLEFNGFSLSISVETESKAKQLFSILSEDGEVTMPLEKTFWSSCFGMLNDRFGLSWMISVTEDSPQF